MEGQHLKHISDSELSPLLLAACITSQDYQDALKILKGQGCELAKGSFESPVKTGYQAEGDEAVRLLAYVMIGEYLANAGGDEVMPKVLNEIFNLVMELKSRPI